MRKMVVKVLGCQPCGKADAVVHDTLFSFFDHNLYLKLRAFAFFLSLRIQDRDRIMPCGYKYPGAD